VRVAALLRSTHRRHRTFLFCVPTPFTQSADIFSCFYCLPAAATTIFHIPPHASYICASGDAAGDSFLATWRRLIIFYACLVSCEQRASGGHCL